MRTILLNKLKQNVYQPKTIQKSNLYQISPANEINYQNIINILIKDNFKLLLHNIRINFGFDNLAVFQLTFMGISYCKKSYFHYNFNETCNKAFNLLVPIQITHEAYPELLI